MYRLLIVDDEEIIVNGLYEIFGGMKELDLDVYKAYSGEMAIAWLRRTRIDIVLTDINMPGIGGLELLEEIQRNWPQCRVIFLTGYSEFEYVYRAIRHPGVSYILKTEDHERVIGAVIDAIAGIQQETRTEVLIQKAKEQINMACELFQNDYLLQLLRGTVKASIELFEQLGIPMHPAWPVLLILSQVESAALQELSYLKRTELLYSIRLVLYQYLGANVRLMAVMDENSMFALFVQPRESLKAAVYPENARVLYDRAVMFIRGTLESVQNTCRESLGAPVSFVISAEPCQWSDVSNKHYTLSEMLRYRIGTGIEMLLTDTEFGRVVPGAASMSPEPSKSVEELSTMLRRGSLNDIPLLLESGQRDKCLELIGGLAAPLNKIRSKNSNLAIEAYTKAAMGLLAYINRRKLTEKLAFHIAQNRLIRFDTFDSWGEAVDYLTEMAGLLFSMQDEEQTNRAVQAVGHLQAYIESNLSEDLSLVRLAEQVYLNPSYLSRLFKQVTGVNLSDFIESARVKHAKELLEKDCLRVNEIARRVGYDTAASFTRFFRKSTGTSPQEYRDAYFMESTKDNNVKCY
jgi:two-component system, response regulator YesN